MTLIREAFPNFSATLTAFRSRNGAAHFMENVGNGRGSIEGHYHISGSDYPEILMVTLSETLPKGDKRARLIRGAQKSHLLQRYGTFLTLPLLEVVTDGPNQPEQTFIKSGEVDLHMDLNGALTGLDAQGIKPMVVQTWAFPTGDTAYYRFDYQVEEGQQRAPFLEASEIPFEGNKRSNVDIDFLRRKRIYVPDSLDWIAFIMKDLPPYVPLSPVDNQTREIEDAA